MNRFFARLAGPVLFLLVVALPAPAGMSEPAKWCAAVTLWIAVWWITEAVHTSVTALLPLVLFPLAGVMPIKNVAPEYANEIIYLFIGGFIFGKAIERWNLHRRIALRMVHWLGSRPSTTLLGFMVATAFISMWISNTATAVMMTPVAIAVAGGTTSNFSKSLLLGVGYSCSIGGLGTLVGTPTNAIFVSFVRQKMEQEVSFAQWFMVGFPIMLLLLVACWLLLLWLFPLRDHQQSAADSTDYIRQELKSLGPLSPPEIRLMIVFGLIILGWISGSLLWYRWWPNINDTVLIVGGAVLLFLVPAKGWKGETLMDWATAERIQWGIIVLFGGGLALAKGFDQSGLAGWLGGLLQGLNHLPVPVIILAVLVLVVLLSEIASNIATAAMMMPVLAALATAIGIHPFGLLMTATLAASIGFGLPVATAPNTIVYGSGFLTVRDMARAGFLLDAVAILILLAAVYFLIPLVWGIQL
ncbi:MAG: SLC13/DASS family transporter [Saprospiraceae bacterium]|nr:SLC13/DASS family transporter [Saprospiraceae bacterium]